MNKNRETNLKTIVTTFSDSFGSFFVCIFSHGQNFSQFYKSKCLEICFVEKIAFLALFCQILTLEEKK